MDSESMAIHLPTLGASEEPHVEIGEAVPALENSVLDPARDDDVLSNYGVSLEDKQWDDLAENIENVYLKRIASGERQYLFSLGYFYYQKGQFKDARKYLERCEEKDIQSNYLLAIIYFDGLEVEPDQKRAIKLLKYVALNANDTDEFELRCASQYLLGHCYFQGFGVRRSDTEAESWWLRAADDGNPKASVLAQSSLGLFYSRKDTKNLKQAFFWHNEACGNGNLESQAALGVMYEFGFGTTKNDNAAFECYRKAAERGNIYAIGCLIACYYRRKMFTKCVELSSRMCAVSVDCVDELMTRTDLAHGFVCKGLAMGCFYYARCLQQGLGVQKDAEKAKEYFSKSFDYDPDVCAKLQNLSQHGII